jgi:hypothetical protein
LEGRPWWGRRRIGKTSWLKMAAEDMLADTKWKNVSWRNGTKGRLKARFAAVRVRTADGPPQGHRNAARLIPAVSRKRAAWRRDDCREAQPAPYARAGINDQSPGGGRAADGPAGLRVFGSSSTISQDSYARNRHVGDAVILEGGDTVRFARWSAFEGVNFPTRAGKRRPTAEDAFAHVPRGDRLLLGHAMASPYAREPRTPRSRSVLYPNQPALVNAASGGSQVVLADRFSLSALRRNASCPDSESP